MAGSMRHKWPDSITHSLLVIEGDLLKQLIKLDS